MSLRLKTLRGAHLAAWVDALARLRIAVFRDWPYLYEGDLDYERRYLSVYETTERSILVAAFDGEALVGASTALPMSEADPAFAEALAATDLDPGRTYYLAESLLLPAARGQGVYPEFFARREAEGRAQGCTHAAFCGVVRPADHPARPAGHEPLDRVWTRAGYRALPGALAHYSWRDIGAGAETDHPMQLWAKAL